MQLTRTRTKIAALSTLALALSAGLLVAGPLTPPAGPIASTYKTLNEVEPRTAINAANTPGDVDSTFRITQPGSYYLTGNITGAAAKHGIQVECDDVTIDLNGFTLQAAPGSLTGITDHLQEPLPAIKNITVKNGTISGFSSGGIAMEWSDGGRIERVTIRGGGAYGVHLRGSVTVLDSQAIGIAGQFSVGFGLESSANLQNCLARACGTGFAVTASAVENCAAVSCGTGFDGTRTQFRGCTASSSAAIGFDINSYSRAVECIVQGGAIGIRLSGFAGAAERCAVSSSSSKGIEVQGPNARLIGNHVTFCGTLASDVAIHIPLGASRCLLDGNTGMDNQRGLIIEATDCLVVRNSFGRPRTNTNNYEIAFGNRVGPIVKANATASPITAHSGSATFTGSITSTDPAANLNF